MTIPTTQDALLARLEKVRKEKNAVLLGHFYVPGDVQDACDFVGDSLELSRRAAETKADVIMFCGVNFMAETASILCPDRKVLSPSPLAACSLADSVTAKKLRKWRESNPDAAVVSYVNTTAEVKSLCDCCCTSANAVKVVEQYADREKVLFLPDLNLGRYIQLNLGREMEIWPGGCHVHMEFSTEMIRRKMDEYPDALVFVHPESSGASDAEILHHPRVYIGSTSSMIRRAAQVEEKQIIVVTEEGILHRMSAAAPDKELIMISPDAKCEYMKHSTLQQVVECLEQEKYEVKVPDALADLARVPIERMIGIG